MEVVENSVDSGPAPKSSVNFEAAMVLSGVGDALGYKNGHWEFCSSGTKILNEVRKMGGVARINVKKPYWIVSDDTVMHIATGQALIENRHDVVLDELIKKLAIKYKGCMSDMVGREPGIMCEDSCRKLDPWSALGCRIPFNTRAGGCGAAMRAMCIGLRYWKSDQLDQLIAASIESGRLTHHHPTGYLGALASALFTAFAIQGKLPYEWGAEMMTILPKAKEHIRLRSIEVKKNLEYWDFFESRWCEYLRMRNISDGKSEPVFPMMFGAKKRDQFYTYVSFEDCGGSSGHDAPMIAYDAILGCNGNWIELCNRAMFHGGDSDSTGVIAGCLYGAMYGYSGVPKRNYSDLEYKKELETIGHKLYKLSLFAEDSYSKTSPENGETGKDAGNDDSGKSLEVDDTVKFAENGDLKKSLGDSVTGKGSGEEESPKPRINMDVPGRRVEINIRYEAAMVLSGVGDALGYKNGEFETCQSGTEIKAMVESLGGLDQIIVKPPEWIVSDDTLFHMATAKVLIDASSRDLSNAKFLRNLAIEYKNCIAEMVEMGDRSPGETCLSACRLLDPWDPNGCGVPFNQRGGACGAAMRAMCIGLRYPKPEQLGDLVKASVEAGIITHHHPTGYLGSLASAVFTAFAIQSKPAREWGAGLLSVLPRAREFISSRNQSVNENVGAWDYFESRWKEYLGARQIMDGNTDAMFPLNYDFSKRDAFYEYMSYDGLGGSSGHDAPMIAYDAILGCNGEWKELCDRAMFHGGDSDSTGVIAGCLYGALYGYREVPENNYAQLEYKGELVKLGRDLYQLSHTE
ncbi:ADPRH-like protein [Mya arenaria]|uniref:ADP-ribosylhydrolase ARH1 n=1 Tax=Mya arenaria TaxID=6604 RepID=A0ABY7DFF7_MYAAR|nr:ADPRH-like protein [Mya arenaria]